MRRTGISFSFCAIVVLATSWLFSPVLEGQTATGNIQGTVVDTSGAVLPGATVKLTNSGTGFSRAWSPQVTGAIARRP
jgi:hypothetical protein